MPRIVITTSSSINENPRLRLGRSVNGIDVELMSSPLLHLKPQCLRNRNLWRCFTQRDGFDAGKAELGSTGRQRLQPKAQHGSLPWGSCCLVAQDSGARSTLCRLDAFRETCGGTTLPEIVSLFDV